MKITILFFANLKENTKTGKLEIDIQAGESLAELKEKLIVLYPILEKALPNAIFAINQEFATDDAVIPEYAEVAIFPPVSGGSHKKTLIKISEAPVDFESLMNEITNADTGAICSFTGIVRGRTERTNKRETIALEYEAYIPMAEKKMKQVAQEIRTKWPVVDGIVIYQLIGNILAGHPSVHIACSASHRDNGIFEATRYGIDRLKEIVPVWKKEIGPMGEEWIEGMYYPRDGE
ncbi:MAG: molybdenum cofactor biosynthesis protein MoaE [Anaerolineaceae bacterium]|nr:molybdenum cofactor biosynthesis protein MoaE [Anaerolineaceae bacterium]